MAKAYGFDLLVQQVAEAVLSEASLEAQCWAANPRTGDTPIERLFSFALYARSRFATNIEDWEMLFVGTPEKLAQLQNDAGRHKRIFVQTQVELEGVGRVDFLIHVWGCWAREPNGRSEGWRQLVVECDGHDFHERTKEQASRDRSRDRHAMLGGYEVFRFTGSELWRDPWGCAAQVIDWAEKGI